MFALNQKLDYAFNAVRSLAIDIEDIKKQLESLSNNQVSTPQVEPVQLQPIEPSLTPDAVQRLINTAVSTAKNDIIKDIMLIETTLSRKIEGNVHKMVSDKVKVAVDNQKGLLKSLVEEAVAGRQETEVKEAQADGQPTSAADDFEITLSPPTGTAPVKRGGRKPRSANADKSS